MIPIVKDPVARRPDILVTTSLRVEDEQLRSLRVLAKKQRTTVSSLVRGILAAFLHGDLKPR